jgi:uncharacterized membrane protein
VTIRDQKHAERSTAGLSNIRAKLMLVLLCLLWGVNWPVMKIALQEIPPLSKRTISSAFGALTLLGICVASRRCIRIAIAKAWGNVWVISLLNIGLFSILSAYAQIAAATTRVTILAYTMPIWAVLLAWAVLREPQNFGAPKGTLRTPEFISVYWRLTGNSSSPGFASSPCGICIVARCVFSVGEWLAPAKDNRVFHATSDYRADLQRHYAISSAPLAPST